MNKTIILFFWLPLFIYSCGCNDGESQKERDEVLVAELGSEHPVYNAIFSKTALICSSNVKSVTFHNNTFSFKTGDTSMSVGRGAIVENGNAILTAAHNLKKNFKDFVLSEGLFKEIEVLLEHIDDEDDYALLTIQSKIALPHFEINPTPALGHKLLSFGVGWKGSTVDKIETSTSTVFLYHSAYLVKGDSGSPLCDYTGKLVGVNTKRKGFSGKAVAVIPKKMLTSATSGRAGARR